MSANATALISKYLQQAIAAERGFEAQFRGFSVDGDDEEVRAAFATQAEKARTYVEALAGRLRDLGSAPPESRSSLAGAGEPGPILNRSNVIEERTAQNIVAAYSMAATSCALYNVLATVAQVAGDEATELLARECQEGKSDAARQVWHFLPSRSKIAFNMLTVTEVDPAVETRALENRIVE